MRSFPQQQIRQIPGRKRAQPRPYNAGSIDYVRQKASDKRSGTGLSTGLKWAAMTLCSAVVMAIVVKGGMLIYQSGYFHSTSIKASVPSVLPVQNMVQSARNDDTEIQKLRRDNLELRQWKWRARGYVRKVSELRRLLNVVDDTGWKIVTGKVTAQWLNPKTHSLRLNVGEERGASRGHPVMSAGGLLGIAVETTPKTTHVRLLTDPKSRISVKIGRQGFKAILVGTGTDFPRLAMLDSSANIQPGDRVITTPQESAVPAGLLIGKVMGKTGHWRIEFPSAPALTEFASILIAFKDAKIAARAPIERLLPISIAEEQQGGC